MFTAKGTNKTGNIFNCDKDLETKRCNQRVIAVCRQSINDVLHGPYIDNTIRQPSIEKGGRKSERGGETTIALLNRFIKGGLTVGINVLLNLQFLALQTMLFHLWFHCYLLQVREDFAI